MDFTRIQSEKTNETIQYRLNNHIVSKDIYDLADMLRDSYSCSQTNRTRRGNYRHTFFGDMPDYPMFKKYN
jgi:hypothetical protein